MLAAMPPSRRTRQAEARRCTEAMRDLVLGYRAQLDDAMRPTGVTLPQLRLLKAVAQQGDVSAASIARLCHVTPQTLQSMLTRATREGWIERGSSEGNGRIVTASLTAHGEAILQQGMEVAARLEQQLWQGVPLAEMKLFRETLEACLARLNGSS